MTKERLRTLRLAAGMSLDDLSEAAGVVSKQMLSRYERGLSRPTPRVLTALAKAFGVPVSRLLEERKLDVEPVAYRKRSSLGKREQERIHALLEAELLRRVRLQELNRLEGPALPVLSLACGSLEAAERAAESLRADWGLGEAPVMNLTEEFESRLVHVIEVEAPEAFDGVALVARGEKGKPIAVGVAVRGQAPGDRHRLNLAHELGHILLDVPQDLDEEKAAYRFAGAFLAPAASLLREVGERRARVDLAELAALKLRYRMSLQALVFRLRDLRVVSENQARDWFVRIRSSGWTKDEPWPVPREESAWLRRNVWRALGEGLIRRDEAREMLGGEDAGIGQSGERSALLLLGRDERRQRLELSVAESADEYDADRGWLEAGLEEPPR